ncbi:MAG: hydrogenase expression/formation C-terminal domain-containing protein [Gammaproteobacteria bacterium]|nr:hydrogenase expression/formation C-terminal domain-containing protein [Gammaproteobacteria bacterium]
MSLSDIPVTVEPLVRPTGMAHALLREIADHLAALDEAGTENAIDLSSLPMNSADIDELKALLGHGEVKVELETVGRSEFHETIYTGIWWATHFGDDGTKLTERIEITAVPAMIKSHPDDIRNAHRRLRDTLSTDDQEIRP